MSDIGKITQFTVAPLLYLNATCRHLQKKAELTSENKYSQWSAGKDLSPAHPQSNQQCFQPRSQGRDRGNEIALPLTLAVVYFVAFTCSPVSMSAELFHVFHITLNFKTYALPVLLAKVIAKKKLKHD